MVDEAKIEQLTLAARHAALHAYAPYSHFHVGAAVLLATGEIVTGCNVENASYRLTSCAEQVAIGRAVVEHGPALRVLAVAVANPAATACQPCGACRQTLAEFAAGDAVVVYPGAGGKMVRCTLDDLLPAGFVLKADA